MNEKNEATVVPVSVVKELVRRWRERLWLHNYELTILYSPSLVVGGQEAYGVSRRSEGHRRAELEFAYTKDFTNLRRTVVHELLHLWFTVPLAMWDDLGTTKHQVLCDMEESVVEGMARFIVGYSIYDDSDLDVSAYEEEKK